MEGNKSHYIPASASPAVIKSGTLSNLLLKDYSQLILVG